MGDTLGEDFWTEGHFLTVSFSCKLSFATVSAFLWLTRVSLQLQSLQCENSSLRRQVSTQQPYQAPGGPDHSNPSSPSSSSSSSALKRHLSARVSRPMSMYETGSGLKPFLPKGETPYPEETFPTPQPFPTYVSKNLPLAFSPSFSSSPCFLNVAACGWYVSNSRRFMRVSKIHVLDYSTYYFTLHPVNSHSSYFTILSVSCFNFMSQLGVTKHVFMANSMHKSHSLILIALCNLVCT